MKKLTLCIFTLVFPLIVLSQPCLPEGITFNTQSQIDSFQINYPGCTVIEGNVTINGEDITNLNGLNVLISIGGNLRIEGNASLTSLSGLDNLTSVGGNLWISYNDSLSNLTGLEELSYVGGFFEILSNYALTSLNGLEGLISIGEDFYIVGDWDQAGNPSLTSLSGLEGLTSVGGHFYIWANMALTNLSGLEGLTTVGGMLNIYGPPLTSLSGLAGLTSIGGNLVIDYSSLVSLSGLEGVTSIGGNLYVEYNYSLTSLSGIDNISSNSIENLYIEGNYSLSSCEVESICTYLASPNGTVTISGNAPGCNSPEEVQDSCEANAVSIMERYMLEDFNVNPNPFTTSTTLSFRLSKPENVRFTAYNVQSKIVFEMQEKQEKGEQKVQWNADGLPAGMYYYRIQAGDRLGSGKMVKLE
jgi:hypothetical protein